MGEVITEQNAVARQAKQVEHRRQLTSVPFETAVELQTLIVSAAKNGETSASALAQLARAWSELEDRKRIIKMKPLPKPIDVTERKARSVPNSASFTETPAQAKPKRAGKAPQPVASPPENPPQ